MKTSKMKHCQTCGYKEPSSNLVVYCAQCEEIMVHRYCMDGPLKYGGEEVVWFCDECSPRIVQCSKVAELYEDVLENSHLECNGADSIVPVHLSNETKEDIGLKMEKGSSVVAPYENKFDQRVKQKHSTSLVLDVDPKSSLHSNLDDCIKHSPKHVDVVEDTNARSSNIVDRLVEVRPSNSEVFPNEECSNSALCIRDNIVASFADISQLRLPSLNKFPSSPMKDASWRGSCQIHHSELYVGTFKFKAHLSVTASSNVANAVQTLCMPLDLEMVPKSSSWPKRFSEWSPSSEDIGLYFFPMHDRDEKLCASLLEKMVDDDLVLKFTRSDLKLLVFTSFDLPKEMMSYNGKCYLWGVFCSSSHENRTNLIEQHCASINPSLKCIHSKNVSNHWTTKEQECIPVNVCVDNIPVFSPPTISKHKPGRTIHRQVGGGRPPVCVVTALPAASSLFKSTKCKRKNSKCGNGVRQAKKMEKCPNKVAFSPHKVGSDSLAYKHKDSLPHKMSAIEKSDKTQAWWVDSVLNPRLNASLLPLQNSSKFAVTKKRVIHLSRSLRNNRHMSRSDLGRCVQ